MNPLPSIFSSSGKVFLLNGVYTISSTYSWDLVLDELLWEERSLSLFSLLPTSLLVLKDNLGTFLRLVCFEHFYILLYFFRLLFNPSGGFNFF